MIEIGDYVYHMGDPSKKLRVISVGVFNITAIEEDTDILLKWPSAEFEPWPEEADDD